MRKLSFHTAILIVTTLTSTLVSLVAQETPNGETPLEPQVVTVREVFVPNAEMATLLENCKDRVLLSREEFESLLKESLQQEKEEPETVPLRESVLLTSDLAVTVEGEQAVIQAVLEWESFTEKWHLERLPLHSLAIRSATLNGQPAKIGMTTPETIKKGKQEHDLVSDYTLFWQGKGPQRLELELVTGLTLDSVRQEIAFAVPRAPTASETLVVPGDVELKSGAVVLARRVEGEGDNRRTHFDLLVMGDDRHLVLTLNSRRARMVHSVLAKSVQFAEVTSHYEKLHATFSLDVLHQPITRAEFVVPPLFEVAEVHSRHLARWELLERDGQSILVVHFREPVRGQVPLNLAAIRFDHIASSCETPTAWTFSRFRPLDVHADTAVLGLLLETGWNVQNMDMSRFIAIAPQILDSTIPESVFEAALDAPSVRTVAAWYAPQVDGTIRCEFLKPSPMFDVVSHQVLTLNDREQTLRGLLQIAPRHENLFELNLDVPEDWTVTRVSNLANILMPFEQKGKNVRIKIPSGIVAGTVYPLFFEASGNITGWFGHWEEQTLPFPQFQLLGAASERGTISIDVDEDMVVTSENNVRLVPLDNKERTEFLPGVPVDLAFRYLSRPYAADLTVTRLVPRLTARTFSFFRLTPSVLSAQYELHYTVEQAKTRFLTFLLPIETPENITVRGLDGVSWREYTPSTVSVNDKQYRRWDVQLAVPQSGQLKLAVGFEQPMPEESTLSLPIMTAGDVAWQTGLASVEGHEELNLTFAENPKTRQVDVGELAATRYVPGRRLLGVFEGVADTNPLQIVITRNPDFSLPASLVQLVRGEDEIAADGKRTTRAIYDLKTRATFLKIALLENENIWSVSLDGKTVKPQKSGNDIMVDVPPDDDAKIRELEIVWGTEPIKQSPKMFMRCGIRLPDLMVPQNPDAKDENPDAQKETGVVWRNVPVTRIAWNVAAPPGYEVTHVGSRSFEAKTPRPYILQSLQRFFSAEKPRELKPRRSWGFGCSMPASKSEPSMLTADREVLESVSSESVEKSVSQQDSQSGFVPAKQDTSSSSGSFSYSAPGGSGAMGMKSGVSTQPYQHQTLQTVSPVQVRFQTNFSAPLQRHVQFQLIGGSATQLAVDMVNTQVATFGGLLVWGGILCVGLCLAKASRRVKMIYIGTIMILGSLLVLVPGLEFYAYFFNEAVKAGLWVFVIYLLPCVYRFLTRKGKNPIPCSSPPASVILAGVVFFLFAASAQAHDDPAPPVSLPDDAIAAFYDLEVALAPMMLKDGLPDPEKLSHPAQKLLVPYTKYVELWNLVHPKRKTEPVDKPTVDHVVTFSEYRATLSPKDELVVTGRYTVETLVDEPVLVTLPLSRGILTSLKVDNENAKITLQKLPLSDLSSYPQEWPQEQREEERRHYEQNVASLPSFAHYLVSLQGKGTHTIDLTAHFKVERLGGWRTVAGGLPKMFVGKVLLELPEDRMELRCHNRFGQQKWQARSVGEIIETVIGSDGSFSWSWRSKVTEAEVDPSLTADSELRFNIQEDALVLEWDLTLAFRHGKHESLQIRVPADYHVVAIEGDNVRGWENAESDSSTEALIDIELLHAAQERERFNIVLMKNTDLAQADENASVPSKTDLKSLSVRVPHVGVVGAVMHHGRLTLQKNPKIEIKVGDTRNLVMTDLPQMDNQELKKSYDNPLGLVPYRAYRFTMDNFHLPLSVQTVRHSLTVIMQNVIKLTTHEIKLETCCQLLLNESGIFSEHLLLPAGMQLDDIQSDPPVEWSTKRLDSGETELAILWTHVPQNGMIQVNLTGTVLRDSDGNVAMPVIVSQTQFNSHEIVIQSDPAFDVRIDELVACHELSTTALPGWIHADQRSLCRKHLRSYHNGEKNIFKPSANLTLVPREPVVTSESITNVQVGNGTVEELILLDFNIQNASIRHVQFELPRRMADAIVHAPLLQRKEVRVNEEEDTAIFTLWLQDEIMNEFRVLIRNNRELASGDKGYVAIPKIRTGTVLHQFVVFENVGSLDELQVDAATLKGMRKINRQNKEWTNLSAILGGNAIEAYLVADKSDPRIDFGMLRRETVKMSGARIGLAETSIVFGEEGDYQAEQIYHIDSKTEQFLDLQLPQGSELLAIRLLTNREWEIKRSGAAGDFGQPVKPTTRPGEDIAAHSVVRIPIFQTEVGDMDYVVRIVYAGKCLPLRWMNRLEIPFIKVLDVPVGASYARLHLPENHRYKFDGTMSESNQDDISKTVSEYEKQIVAKLQQTAQTGNPYEQVRAMNNLSLKGIVPQFSSQSSIIARPSGTHLEYPASSPQGTTSGIERRRYQVPAPVYETRVLERDNMSNSGQLMKRFELQENYRGKNVVSQSENNWKPTTPPAAGQNAVVGKSQDFDQGWLKSNALDNPEVSNKKEKITDSNVASTRSSFKQEETAQHQQPQQSAMTKDRSRVSQEPQTQQIPAQSLKEQERLNDQAYASRLAGAYKSVRPEFQSQQTQALPQQENTQNQMRDRLNAYSNQLALQQNAQLPQMPQENFSQPVNESQKRQGGLYTAGMSESPESPAFSTSVAFEESEMHFEGAADMMDQSNRRSYRGSMNGIGMGGMSGQNETPSARTVHGQLPHTMANNARIEDRNLNEPVAACAPEDVAYDTPMMAATMETKAASLDVEIPQIGQVFLFTAPQAENRLSFTSVSQAGSQRIHDLGYVIVLTAACVIIGLFVVRVARSKQKNH